MSEREEFETWMRLTFPGNLDFAEWNEEKKRYTPYTMAQMCWNAWQAACAWQREKDAEICEGLENEYWRRYKHEKGPEMYSPHTEGKSDGAAECAIEIRAQGEE